MVQWHRGAFRTGMVQRTVVALRSIRQDATSEGAVQKLKSFCTAVCTTVSTRSQKGLDVQKARAKTQTFCTKFLHDGSPVRILPRLHLGPGLVASAGGVDQGGRGRPRHLPREGVGS